jgi:GPH family glycoside/pentoside/hexuronide:cation symporter
MSSTTEQPRGQADAPPTRRELIFYTLGNSAVVMGNGLIQSLQFPIFNMLLGVNPGMIGTIAGILRLWDALLDPVMGLICPQ